MPPVRWLQAALLLATAMRGTVCGNPGCATQWRTGPAHHLVHTHLCRDLGTPGPPTGFSKGGKSEGGSDGRPCVGPEHPPTATASHGRSLDHCRHCSRAAFASFRTGFELANPASACSAPPQRCRHVWPREACVTAGGSTSAYRHVHCRRVGGTMWPLLCTKLAALM